MRNDTAQSSLPGFFRRVSVAQTAAVMFLFAGAAQANLLVEGVSVPNACHDAAAKTAELVRSYSQFVHDAKSGDADREYSSLAQYVFHDIGESNPCFESALDVLIISASEARSVISEDLYPTSFESAVSDVDQKMLVMMENHKVKFLTPDSRGKMGGKWLDKIPGTDEYATIGGYDCALSTIYVDPYLRPFDLFATVFHEMDHVIRDKTFKPDPGHPLPEKLFSEGAKRELNWSLYNLADEAYALMNSGSRQAELQSAKRYVYGPADLFGYHKKTYSVRNDLTLFSKDGPVYRLKKILEKSDIQWFGNLPDAILEDTVTSKQDYYANKDQVNAAIASARHEIWSSIISAYFPESPPVIPGGDAAEFFNSDLWQFSTGGSVQSGKLDVPFEDSLKESSPMCKAYLDSVNRGEVDHYIGVHFSDSQPSVKAARASVRPCLDLRRKL